MDCLGPFLREIEPCDPPFCCRVHLGTGDTCQRRSIERINNELIDRVHKKCQSQDNWPIRLKNGENFARIHDRPWMPTDLEAELELCYA